MNTEVLFKKIQHSERLLRELEELLQLPFSKFENGSTILRAAERNFQLVIDIASDINTQILLDVANQSPETYKQSFRDMATLGVIDQTLAAQLSDGAKIRNILVHEYDFEEDERKFYDSTKKILPACRIYLKTIFSYITKK